MRTRNDVGADRWPREGPGHWVVEWPTDVDIAEAFSEVHARFGFAAECGNELETALVMLISQLEQAVHRRLSFDDLLHFLEKNGSLTLGKLVDIFVRYFRPPRDLAAELRNAAKARNYLIHHFYRQRAEQFHSPDGCKKLQEELVSIQYEIAGATEQLEYWRDATFGARSYDEALDDIYADVRKWRREEAAMLKAMLGRRAKSTSRSSSSR